MRYFTFCFCLILSSSVSARVIKITYNTTTDVHSPRREGFKCHISITSDQSLPIYTKGTWPEDGIDKKEFRINLKCKDDNPLMRNAVSIKENMETLSSLKLLLQKLFNVSSLNLWKKDTSMLHPVWFTIRLEDIFIKHGYQLTFKDCNNTEDNQYLNTFYFKANEN